MTINILQLEMEALRERAKGAAVTLGSVAHLSRKTKVTEPALSRFIHGVNKALHIENYLKLLYWLDGKTPSL